MRILICEDSEHNLQSAREFAEKVKGEHEVVVEATHPRRGLRGVREGRYDIVLTDLYMPSVPGGEVEPNGLFVALGALQCGVPVAIVTDGKAHSDDSILKALDGGFSEENNEKLRIYLMDGVSRKADSPYYSPHKGFTPEGKAIKDWEFCFRELAQITTAA